MAATNVYVLRLEGGKFYVGKSEDVQKRFQEHRDGHGSEWTRLHKPIKMEAIHPNVSAFEEDMKTKEYMAMYGVENVRGGSYCQTTLTSAQLNTLKTEMRGATDVCNLCGSPGHFMKDCPQRKRTAWMCEKCDAPFPTKREAEAHEMTCIVCNRCGRPGHNRTECYAKTDVNGTFIKAENPEPKVNPKRKAELEAEEKRKAGVKAEIDEMKDRLKAEMEAEERMKVKAEKGSDTPAKPIFCYRCGRFGHYAPKCFATTHRDGHVLK